jgi:NAD(P)H-flavin reductase
MPTQKCFVEKGGNNYAPLALVLSLVGLVIYGAVFFYGQASARRALYTDNGTTKRRTKSYFKFLSAWNKFNSSIRIKLPGVDNYIFIQPSLFALAVVYLGLIAIFCFNGTLGLSYGPRLYNIGLRMGDAASANLPVLFLCITMTDTISVITGLAPYKVNFIHRWLGRLIYCMLIVHFSLLISSCLSVDLGSMFVITAQIFGIIAFAAFTVLVTLSTGIIRRLSYEFFLFNHAVLVCIFLLCSIIHNGGTAVWVIISALIFVADRSIAALRCVIAKRLSPTHCVAKVRALDDSTVEVIVKMESHKYLVAKLENGHLGRLIVPYLPTFGTWKPGQFIYIRMGSVKLWQWHPFSIAAVPKDKDIRLVIRKHGGFTKALHENAVKLQQETEKDYVDIPLLFHGPYGGHIQPLITFENVLFVAGGSGASFTFPVALDLIQQVVFRNSIKDMIGRPETCHIKLVWYIRRESDISLYHELLNKLRTCCDAYSSVWVEIYVTGDEAGDEGVVESFCPAKYDFQRHELSRGSYQMHYYKRDLQQVVEHEVGAYIESARNRSMALVVCGPKSMTSALSYECQRLRRHHHTLDLYFYAERYTV